MTDKFNANVHFTKKISFFDPIHDVIEGQGKKGTKFIIRQRNGLKM